MGNDGHQNGRNDGAYSRAGVEDAGGEGAFLRLEPLRGGLDRGREISALAEAEEEPRDAEAHYRTHQRMRHRRKAPEARDDGIALAATHAIDEAASEDYTQRVCELERAKDVSILMICNVDRRLKRRPARKQRMQLEDLPVQAGLQDRQHLAIDIVDRRRHEQHGADGPAPAQRGRFGQGLVLFLGAGHLGWHRYQSVRVPSILRFTGK